MGCGCDHVGPRSQALVSVGRPLDSQAGLDMSVSRASRSLGGGWWQKWFSAAGVSFRLPLTSTVTPDLNLPGRRAMQKAPKFPWTVSWGGGGCAWNCFTSTPLFSRCARRYHKQMHSNNNKTATSAVQGVQTAEQDLPLCPCRGARCVSAEILGCLPSPLAEPTSASATGMLLSESPVLPRWQKLWIMASSARDPSVKSPQRPRSSQGDGRDHPAEAWCECLLPLGGTVFQRMPAELPSSGAGRSYQLLFQLPSVGGPRLPNR